jgi:hypothetical protein
MIPVVFLALKTEREFKDNWKNMAEMIVDGETKRRQQPPRHEPGWRKDLSDSQDDCTISKCRHKLNTCSAC